MEILSAQYSLMLRKASPSGSKINEFQNNLFGLESELKRAALILRNH